ncbi:hypothetical protein BU17DRAFT_76555 [Hysterangium stoloniferum]|nr:hypothetical protein BU17DRAFT_76555 [Hysterangium stoloniferum]
MSRANTPIPVFLQGETICGTVELALEKTEHIQAVTIELRAECLTVGEEPIPFVNQEETLWSTSMGNPGSGSSTSGSPKLKGQYVWPYSLTLPETVKIPTVPNGPVSEYALPPSFSERASPSYLEYKIVVTLRRGRLRVDNVLATSFGYLPRIRPPPASSLRQLSYEENGVAPPPKVDPEGWHDFGVKSVSGTVFDSRQVEVASTLSVARGTSIPFTITLNCSDKQALDLFSARGSLSVKLVRSLIIGVKATEGSKAGPNQRTDTVFTTDVGEGVYWPAEDNVPSSESRRLDGEISVKTDLKPSFVFPNMTLKYHVSFALTAPGFIIPEGVETPTYSCEVEVATIMPLGPAPRSKIPAAIQQGESGNYDVSIGMLTGANQRFLHQHHTMG